MTHAVAKTQPLPPRGLNIRQAAAYWGVSPGTFKKLVRLGFAPSPLEIPGLDRNIYDRLALDRAMDARGSHVQCGGKVTNSVGEAAGR